MELIYKSPEEWSKFAADAHLVVFGEHRPPDLNRIDFAVLTVDNGVPMTFMTAREFDAESIYMQYGGSFPTALGTLRSYKSYDMIVSDFLSKYKRVTTLVENTNTPMLKFAMKRGLRIIGMRTFKGTIFLEHLIEREC